MNLFLSFSLINGITATVLGIFVFFKDRKSLINKTFFLMSLGVAIWSFSYCKWLLVEEREIALFWSRMLNFGATLIPIFYLHWIFSLLDLVKKKRKLLFLGYLMTFVFLCFSFTPYYIKSVKPTLSFPYWPQAGPLYICFLFLGYFGLVGYGLYQLFKTRKTSFGDKRAQIDYVILGSIMGFGGGSTNFPLMFGISLLPPVGQPLIALYVIILTFAITRYHLFGIIVILTELLVAVIGLVMIIQIFIAPNLLWRLINGIVFVLFIIVGYYLIRATIREIRRREEMEKLSLQLKAANVELDKLSKAKSEFISIASHQLRTPLSIVKGYISMILGETYGALPKTAKRPLENVYKSNERLINLVNNLLNISRIESGRMEFEPEKISIEEIIDGVVFDLRINAEKKKLYLKWKKPEPSLPKILLDKDKMRQVILNLVDNAIKYTQQGGITIKLLIANCKLLIAIADTGEGMTKEDLGKIFESFSRGTVGTRAYTEGAGLGLYIARRFVEMHNGKIWAESEGKGKGSTFYIELPMIC